MPLAPEVDFSQLEKQLKKYPEIFQKNGAKKGVTLKSRNDDVWVKIKEDLGLKMQLMTRKILMKKIILKDVLIYIFNQSYDFPVLQRIQIVEN